MNALFFSTWLHEHLPSGRFAVAFLFGSAVRADTNPGDCDLFLVTRQTPGTPQWNLLRHDLEDLREHFHSSFGIPLSIELLSSIEYAEWLTWKDPVYCSPKLYILEEDASA